MNRQEMRKHVKEIDIRTLYDFTKSKGRGMYVCPICHSGEGKNKTGALQINETGTRITCHANGCFGGSQGEDTLGALRILWNATETEVFNRLEAGGFGTEMQKNTAPIQANKTEEKETDYSAFFAECHSHIGDTDYHRGLSVATLDRFNIGYVAAWRHPKVPDKVPTSPRLIVPTSAYSYIARDTREALTEKQEQYKKQKVGHLRIFNSSALSTARKPIFIVEGEIDAASIVDVGGEAIGLGSINSVDSFLKLVETRKPAQPLIIALDNEEDAEKQKTVEAAADKLKAGLQRLNIPFYEYNPCGSYHDANAALMGNRSAFTEAVEAGENIGQQAEEEEKAAYLNSNTAAFLQNFINGISESVNTECIPTGFRDLDSVLDGGLYEGLYTVGAISSLGKTSLVLQIADKVAQSGHDVLVFSLEMSRAELMSKSISRHTLEIALKDKLDTRNAKTSRGITDGKRYVNYSKKEADLIGNAIKAYGEYAEHLYIQEGVGDIGTDQIRETIEKHIRFTGHRPLVIVDYLQIVAPYNDRATDKQNTDKCVLELKRISRDCKLPVIAISSFNRSSYKAEAQFESMKESGAIEYGSDVVFGLQLKGAGKKDFDPTAEKKRDPRAIELVILKNRQGRVGDKIAFDYYPMFNYFLEHGLTLD